MNVHEISNKFPHGACRNCPRVRHVRVLKRSRATLWTSHSSVLRYVHRRSQVTTASHLVQEWTVCAITALARAKSGVPSRLDGSAPSVGCFHSGHKLPYLRLASEVMFIHFRLVQETTSPTDWLGLKIFVDRAPTQWSSRRQPRACQTCALPATEWKGSVCKDAAQCALTQREVHRWRETMSSSSTSECAVVNYDWPCSHISSNRQHGSFRNVLGCAIAWRGDLAQGGGPSEQSSRTQRTNTLPVVVQHETVHFSTSRQSAKIMPVRVTCETLFILRLHTEHEKNNCKKKDLWD